MEKLSWVEYKKLCEKRDTAVLPLGAIEAHGPHLPLATDNYIAGHLAQKLADRINAFLLPVLPFGQVWSLENFPGTINIQESTLSSFIQDIAHSLHRHGLKYLVVVNSHIGNVAALKRVARAADITVLTFTHPDLKKISAKVMDSRWCHPSYMHAEEVETSMLLAIAPELVRMEQAVSEYPEFPLYFDHTPVRWEEVTKSGVLGDPRPASADKGQYILQEIVAAMEKIYNQHRRDYHEQ